MNFEQLIGRRGRTVAISVKGQYFLVMEPSALQMLDFREERKDSLQKATAKLLRECVLDQSTGKPAFNAVQADILANSPDTDVILPYLNALFGFAKREEEGEGDEKKESPSPRENAKSGEPQSASAAPAENS